MQVHLKEQQKRVTGGAEQIIVSHEPVVLFTQIVDKLIKSLFSVKTVQLSPPLHFRLITATLICIILTLHHYADSLCHRYQTQLHRKTLVKNHTLLLQCQDTKTDEQTKTRFCFYVIVRVYVYHDNSMLLTIGQWQYYCFLKIPRKYNTYVNILQYNGIGLGYVQFKNTS